MMHIFVLIVAAHGSGRNVVSPSSVIPVRLDGRSDFYVNVIIPNLYGNTTIVPFSLSPGALSGSSVLGADEVGSAQVTVQHTWLYTASGGQFRFEDQRHHFMQLSLDFAGSIEPNTPEGYLGIGSGSSLVNTSIAGDGSVAFVRDYQGVSDSTNPSYLLQLNLSSRWFNTTACIPESVMSVPIVAGPNPLTTMTRISFQMGTTVNTAIETVSLTSSPYMFTVPYPLYAVILDAGLPHAVLVGSGQYIRFQNCNALRTTLPTISLNFQSAGYLRIPPEDYLVDIGEDQCELLVTNVPIGGAPFINPLMIPGMNIRFTAESVLFCDSAL